MSRCGGESIYLFKVKNESSVRGMTHDVQNNVLTHSSGRFIILVFSAIQLLYYIYFILFLLLIIKMVYKRFQVYWGLFETRVCFSCVRSGLAGPSGE